MNVHVEVYRNLHNGKLSVRDRKTKRVLAHCDEVTLGGVIFRVSQAGRERVIREKRKNVHAFACGKLLGYEGAVPYKGRSIADHVWQWADGVERQAVIGKRKVTYNPYKYRTFVLPDTGFGAIRTAPACHISSEGIHIGVLQRGLGTSPDIKTIP